MKKDHTAYIYVHVFENGKKMFRLGTFVQQTNHGNQGGKKSFDLMFSINYFLIKKNAGAALRYERSYIFTHSNPQNYNIKNTRLQSSIEVVRTKF